MLIDNCKITWLLSFLISSIPALKSQDTKYAYISQGNAIPNAVLCGAIHRFEIHVQSQALSELVIKLPVGVTFRKGIEVKNKLGQKFAAKTFINDRKTKIVFCQPVPPQTRLEISMKDFDTIVYSRIWMYRLYGKIVSMATEIPLGSVWVQTDDK
ncbi:DUF2808 domain-containing protein [Nostoc sp. MS1]|uniref:DUF2808 domain-containing protein n=1 Tax=Nostoc sp. MS1 TaxID=2764711 RepID=UPI001CC5657D|nr:DUF2808 domain-containing protein [Nostoc sp. MS1]BCL38004.1 hypothetical protein NSMS1_44510 [Nostoc sp. MS1]